MPNPLAPSTGVRIEQLFQNGAAQLMHGGAERHLDCFQIQPGVRSSGENACDDAAYLARGLFMDDLREVFFSPLSSDTIGSGRASQMNPFTSISFSLSARNCL